jgi:hypothetical protein
MIWHIQAAADGWVQESYTGDTMKMLNKKAFSVVEYTVLFIIVVGAFLIMRSYIQRGIYGEWGRSGQSLAFGRQYDPQKSIECGFDEQSNLWYDHNCVESQCLSGSPSCMENVIAGGSCAASSCAQLNQ